MCCAVCVQCTHIRGAAHHDPLNNWESFHSPPSVGHDAAFLKLIYTHYLNQLYVYYNLRAAVDKRVIHFVY